MAVLGIITCEILSNEFAYLLGTDPRISQINIIENSSTKDLIKLLENKYNKEFQTIPHLNNYIKEPSENIDVIVTVLELELHRNIKILRKAIKDATKSLAHYVNAFLFGYGLCGNALENLSKLIETELPLFIPMDDEHPVDDCVGLIIGGRKCYYTEQCKEPGTFFMIPGWSKNWKKILDKNLPDNGIATVKRMFSKYKRILLLPNQTTSLNEMKKEVKDFTNITGLEIETKSGTMHLLNQTWNLAIENILSKEKMLKKV